MDSFSKFPKGPIHKLLVKEVHGGGLASHLGINKIIDILKRALVVAKDEGDVHDVISKCVTCHQAKS